MAGTARSGVTTSLTPIYATLPGMNQGQIPFAQRSGGLPLPVLSGSLLDLTGPRTAAVKVAAVKAAIARVGATAEVHGGIDFYDKLHILPRTKIDFQAILAQVDDEFEVYNAHRSSDASLTSINNPALPGLIFPNIGLPETIESQTSLLDTSSTDNSGGTALGTLVKAIIRALLDGLPSFDTAVTFDTDLNDPILFVAGLRVINTPILYEETGLTERLEFATRILAARSGKEQRVSIRKQPRQIFAITFRLNAEERQQFEHLMIDWTDQIFGLPLFHEAVQLTADAGAASNSFSVSGADEVDFRVGGRAGIYSARTNFDVLKINTVSATTITTSESSAGAHLEGALVMPVRLARVSKVVQGRRFKQTLQDFTIEFEVTDNDTGALTGDLSAYNTFNGRTLFDDCNLMDGETIQEAYRRNVTILDSVTGIVNQSTTWDLAKHTSAKGFLMKNRAEILKVRRALLALRGRQKSFYTPTFFDDLIVDDDLVLGSSTIDVANVQYSRLVKERDPKKHLKITFTDGTSLERTVLSSLQVDADTERLTLNTTWPANRTVSEVSRIGFYEPNRFDTDVFEIQYGRVGEARMIAPTINVFDDQ